MEELETYQRNESRIEVKPLSPLDDLEEPGKKKEVYLAGCPCICGSVPVLDASTSAAAGISIYISSLGKAC